MKETFKITVTAVMVGGLVWDMTKFPLDVPHPHTHEEPIGPVQTVSLEVAAVSSGKEMSGWPLVINRPRQKAPL